MNSTYSASSPFHRNPQPLKKQSQLLEQASLVGAILGTVAATLSQQVLFASLPFSLSLALMSQANRRRFELEEQRQKETIVRLQTANQSIIQQLQDLNATVTELQQNPQKYLTKTHLTPITAKLRQLQRQYKAMELDKIATLTQQIHELQQQINTHPQELPSDSQKQIQPIHSNKPTQHFQKRPHRHHQERIAIFIDGANLYHTAKALGVDLNYLQLLSVLQAKSSTCQAFFYTGVNSNDSQQKQFLSWLQNNGYQVISKEVIQRTDGSMKANLDVELALDLVKLANSYDTAILVSGDGDFRYAVQTVQSQGKRVEVASFATSTSKTLVQTADAHLELDCIFNQIYSPAHPSLGAVIPLKQRNSLNKARLSA